MAHREVDVPPTNQRALEALELLSKKWNPVVVVALAHHGPMGFNDLSETIPDVSGKVLSGTLDALQDAGLLERREVSESPLRVEYRLTDAGRDMSPIFEALGEWGERHLEGSAPRVVLADPDRRITEMYGQWLADRYAVVRVHDGDGLDVHLDDRIDVLLIDASLPGADPGRIVEERREDCRTIVLVGDRPEFGLLDVACDDLLRKPIVRETALAAIEDQLRRQTDPEERRELASLTARRSLVESVYPQDQLEASESYRDLRERIDELSASAEE